MLSQTIRTTSRVSVRAFSAARVAMSEGSIAQDKGKFSENERAQEAVYIKKHEAEQLKALKKQLDEQKATISNLEKELEDISNNKK